MTMVRSLNCMLSVFRVKGDDNASTRNRPMEVMACGRVRRPCRAVPELSSRKASATSQPSWGGVQ